MSEENTERLEGSTPFEIRVLRELANLNHRLTALEEKVDSRLQDTRPIWEAVLARLDSMETRLNSIDARLDSMDTRLEKVEDKFEAVAGELLDMRTDISRVKKRLPAA
jgi:tetrahydromethanopterin S-methyltransferase subunit G